MIEWYDQIAAYFNGGLSEEAILKFDLQVQSDPAFAEAVAFYFSSQQAVLAQLADEKKQRFRELYAWQGAAQQKQPPVIYLNKWWKAAMAAAVIFVVAATWLWWPQPSAASLADKYVQDNFYVLAGTMGVADSLQQGINLNNNNQLPAALHIFEALTKADSNNEAAIKNAGIVSLRMKDYDKTLRYFTRLENMTYLHSNPGKFYKALTLLERNLPDETQKAKQLLEEVVQNNLQGASDARRILKRL